MGKNFLGMSIIREYTHEDVQVRYKKVDVIGKP